MMKTFFTVLLAVVALMTACSVDAVEQSIESAEPVSAEIAPLAEPVVVDPTTALGVEPSARYGYFASRNAWLDPVACDGLPGEILVGVDVQASTSDEVVLFNAGFVTVGNVQQMSFSSEGRAAALISCGESTATPWLQIIDFDAQGRVTEVGPELALPEATSASGPYLGDWVDDDSVVLYTYPDNGLEELRIAVATGERLEHDQQSETSTTDPSGTFGYRVVDDPQGRTGCEGNGFMVTLEVEGPAGLGPAFAGVDQVFTSVSDLQFGPNGLVAWNSWCHGFATPHVGEMLGDGTIADVRQIEVDEPSTEYRDFRLSDDGFLVSVGARYAPDVDPAVALFSYEVTK